MIPNRFLGVLSHWLGGFASGSFGVAGKGPKQPSWQ